MDSDEYLGSDGVRMSQAYNNYLARCDEFLARARHYKHERMRRKQSIIHSDILGYEPNESFENEVLEKRNLNIKTYEDSFYITKFDENKDSMYENLNQKVKRIRIIRELSEPRKTENFSAGGQSWFLRFRNLSRFVQVVRMTILKQRLENRLNILKRLTPEIIEELEHDDMNFNRRVEELENTMILSVEFRRPE